MKLICMAFDGAFVTERGPFDTTEKAWEHANDMGSRWFFYPFHFVVTDSGKTIVDAPEPLEHFIGKRTATVQKILAKLSKREELQSADPERFAFAIHRYSTAP